MITVIASIRVKPGRAAQFLEIFKSNIPSVQAEEGCVEYYPAVDIPTGLPVQESDENLITVIEKWENLDALLNHLTTPHMLVHRENVKDLVEELSIRVLKRA